MPLFAVLGALGLAAVHLWGGKLRFLDVVPRSRWLSFAGGISVAYVFLHLLPELEEGQQVIARTAGRLFGAFEHHTYLIALAGLAVFYGLERWAKASRGNQREEGREDSTSPRVFWISILSFAVYNLLIGYILAERDDELQRFLFFWTAMALHFLVNDFGLREDHKGMYRQIGRWILAGAVVLGAVAGLTVRISDLALLLPTAFIAGGVVLNVLKEELPEERRSVFWAFATGLVAYSVLLLTL